MAEIEYDSEKARQNIDKHGVSLEHAARIFHGSVVEYEDSRKDYNETRFIAMGAVDGRVYVIVYTWRNGRRRIISARKANRREQHDYYSKDA
ncbi:MAG: BrnT family toxin [Rhodovibrio sp.]|nr:BrnT family toxin [Rhodovibrio sp.]